MADVFDPSMDPEEFAIRQAMSRAAALRKQPAPAEGQMVSGQYVRAPKLAGLVPILNGLVADNIEGNAVQQQQALTGRQREALNEWLSARPTAKTTYGASDVGPTMTTTEPTEADTFAWASQGLKSPLSRALGSNLIEDQIVNAPLRAEQRKDKAGTLALTLAEKKEQQARELEYRRERDKSAAELKRDIAEQSNAMRRELAGIAAAARSSGGGGGDKASNYQIVTDERGNAVRVNKLTGEVSNLGNIGKQDAALTKDSISARDQTEQSNSALSVMPEVRSLIKKSTGSAGGAVLDAVARAGGYATEGAKATKALAPYADIFLKAVPRFEGPQSDKDTAAYKEAAGDLANPNLTREERLVALGTIEKLHKKTIDKLQSRSDTTPKSLLPKSNPAGTVEPPKTLKWDDLK